jgi:hypothetical protein
LDAVQEKKSIEAAAYLIVMIILIMVRFLLLVNASRMKAIGAL